MALLGGLMRGTAGAFIRGSLDTATNIIQASSERDAEEVQNRVKGFGTKYDSYSQALNDFNTESEMIDDVARTLSAQDDAFLKGQDGKILPMDQLTGIAQELITISGAKNAGDAIKYFTDNRDKISPILLPTADAPTTPSVDAQTDAAVPTQTAPAPVSREPTGFFDALGRAFAGADEAEMVSRVARDLGISVDEYRRVMAGKLPVRKPSRVLLSIEGEDKLEEIIDTNQGKALSVVSSQDFLRGPELQLPDYKNAEGETVAGPKFTRQAFATSLMSTYQNYKLTGEGADTLARMQTYALTTIMPDEAKGFFTDIHGTSINAIAGGLGNPKITDANRAELGAIYTDITDYMVKSATPGYVPKPEDITAVNNLVLDGMKLVATQTVAGEDGKSPQYKLLDQSITDLVSRAGSTSASAPQVESEDDMRAIFGLRQELAEAEGDEAAMKALAVKVAKLSATAFTPAPETGSTPKYDQEVAATVADLAKMPRFANIPVDQLEVIAKNYLIDNPSGPKRGADGQLYVVLRTSQGEQVSVPVGTETSEGLILDMSDKRISQHEEQLKENNTSLTLLAGLTTSTIDNPLVFTAFGRMAVGGSTYADIVGDLTGTNVGAAYRDFFNIPENAETQRQAIELVGNAKDRLFDDPRLSDQDLALVLQYIAVLETDGIGVGSTRAVAALQGLQMAVMKDTAMRLYDLGGGQLDVYPATTLDNGELFWYKDDGQFVNDGSLATRLYKQLNAAYGNTILSRPELEELRTNKPQEFALYAARQDMIENMVEVALHDIVTFEALGVDTIGRPSNLMRMGDVDSNGQMTIDGETYQVASVASLKRNSTG